MQTIFITGIGTGVGKTLVSAILAEALQADYWKPVQAGTETSTDSDTVQALVRNDITKIHKEVYRLKLAASPHIAAAQEGVTVDVDCILKAAVEIQRQQDAKKVLLIEGAGGVLSPLNSSEKIADLIAALDARVILVSRNYLGSINHSLMTARVCSQYRLRVLGWIFNEQNSSYEDDIVRWSGIRRLGSIPLIESPGVAFVSKQAQEFSNQVPLFSSSMH